MLKSLEQLATEALSAVARSAHLNGGGAPPNGTAWAAANEAQNILLTEIRRLQDRLSVFDCHGCLTGDCPHTTQAACDAALVAFYKETVAENMREDLARLFPKK